MNQTWFFFPSILLALFPNNYSSKKHLAVCFSSKRVDDFIFPFSIWDYRDYYKTSNCPCSSVEDLNGAMWSRDLNLVFSTMSSQNYSQMCNVLWKSLKRVILILHYPCVLFQKHFNTVFASATVQFSGFCCICVNARAFLSSGRWRCKIDSRKDTVVPSCFGTYLKVIKMEQSMKFVYIISKYIYTYHTVLYLEPQLLCSFLEQQHGPLAVAGFYSKASFWSAMAELN